MAARLAVALGVACLLTGGLSCRRRVPGVCADHVECEAGFDCVGGRCVRRPAFPAETAAPPTVTPDSQPLPAARETAAPTEGAVDAGGVAPRPVPTKKVTPPAPVRPAPPPPPAGREPLWQQRRKNS